MRKSLVLALVAASMLLGCGYDNGKDASEKRLQSDYDLLDSENNEKDAIIGALENEVLSNNKTISQLTEENKSYKEKEELLLPLPSACLSTTDCKSEDGKILGICEEKVCKRTCKTTNDCEDQAICDGGVCRSVVPCPSLKFDHLSDDIKKKADEKYKEAKCIKVFSHTPSISFATALKKDAEIVGNALNDPLTTGDFSSDNYVFTIPQNSLDEGLSFGMIMYATVRFINLLSDASNGLAECLRPEVLDENNYEYNGIGGSAKDDGYEYLSQYHYSFTNESLNPNAVVSLCDNGTSNMNYDMMAYAIYQYYVNYATENKKDPKEALKLINFKSLGEDKKKERIVENFQTIVNELLVIEEGKVDYNNYLDFLSFLYSDYMKMVKTKKTCLNEVRSVDSLMVMADLTAYVTDDKQSQLAALAGAVQAYANNPETIKSDDGAITEMISYLSKESKVWSQTLISMIIDVLVASLKEKNKAEEDIEASVEGVKNLLQNKSFEEIVKYIKESYPDTYSDKEAELEMLIGLNKIWKVNRLTRDFEESNYVIEEKYFEEGKYIGTDGDYIGMMSNTIMNSQKRLCIETLAGVQQSKAFSRFNASSEMQLDACIMAPTAISSLINSEKISTTDKADKILYSGDYNAIHAALLEPNYLWFSNASLMPIAIKLGDNKPINPDALIIDTMYSVPSAFFDDLLVGDTYIQAFPEKYKNDIEGENNSILSDVVSRVKNIVDLNLNKTNKNVFTTRNEYFKINNQNSHHYFLYDIDTVNKNEDGIINDCNNNRRCEFEFSIVSKKMEDSIAKMKSFNESKVDTSNPYKCGGLVYNVSKIDGYVVLPDGYDEFSKRTVAVAEKSDDNHDSTGDSSHSEE